MENSINNALKALVEAVRASQPYQECATAKRRIAEDPLLDPLIDRYESTQYALQAAAIAGKEPPPEDEEQFRRLNLLLLEQEDANAYFMAKMKYDQMICQLYEALSDGLSVRPPKEQ